MGYMPFVAFEVYELSVKVSCFEFLVSQDLLYVFDVFGSVIFHGGFPMAECMKVDLFYSRVL